MIGAIGKPAVEQARDIARCHRAIGNAAPLGCDLDQRLEIEKAPRSGPNDRHVDAAPLGFGGDGPRHMVGADRKGRGILRHVTDARHGPRSAARPSISASKRAGLTRPWSCSSIMTAGDRAQLPRQ